MDIERVKGNEMFSARAAVRIEWVAVLKNRREQRGLKLIPEQTRALCRHEIHEFILTDEPGRRPGETVNRVAYLGFGVVKTGGILVVGDKMMTGDLAVGKLIGFDQTHMPNHMNIVLFSEQMLTGEEHGFVPGQIMIIGD